MMDRGMTGVGEQAKQSNEDRDDAGQGAYGWSRVTGEGQ